MTSSGMEPNLREMNIYAEVEVAGHDRLFSTRMKHGYWRIKREVVSAVPGHNVRRPRNILLTELVRRNFTDLRKSHQYSSFLIDAEEDLSRTATVGEIADYLRSYTEGPLKALNPKAAPIDVLAMAQALTQSYEMHGIRVQPLPVRPEKAQHRLARVTGRA
jgi:hypothetical protein